MLWPLMHNWQWLELRYVYVFVHSSVFVHLGMELGSCEQCPVDPLVVDDFAEKSRVEANGSCKGLATGFFVPLKRQTNQGCQPPTPRIQYVKYQVFFPCGHDSTTGWSNPKENWMSSKPNGVAGGGPIRLQSWRLDPLDPNMAIEQWSFYHEDVGLWICGFSLQRFKTHVPYSHQQGVGEGCQW